MVRARTNRVVMSQRDIRQTVLKEPAPHAQPTSHTRCLKFCTWCHESGQHFACLAESSHTFQNCDSLVHTNKWPISVMNNEGWAPASGPCCEDCLEAAFDQQRKARVEMTDSDLMDETQSWCRERGEHMLYSLQQGWNICFGWLGQWTLRNPGSKVQADQWSDVTFEAEGFLEVKVVVTKDGAMQHMEVDFPTDVAISVLKAELATVIDIPAASQVWYYLAQRLDDSKTLEEHNIDIGAIIEVKCQ